MSLTGFPLIVTGIVGTLAAVIATVMLWNRLGRMRHVVRPTGVLLAEVLLLVTVGLVVNRSEEFYPTWAALLDTKTAGEAVRQTTDDTRRGAPGALDHQLAVRAGGRTGDAQAFGWQSADWRGWGLAAAPTVFTPPGYLQHPTWSYSAVVVLGAGPAGWGAAEEAAARRATATGLSAVVVFATPTAATTAPGLAAALPEQLGRDLRVTAHRWAIVTSAGDAVLARDAAGAATVRYSSIVVIPAAARSGTGGRPGTAGRPGGTDGEPARALTTLPPGVTAAAVATDAAAPTQAGVEALPSTAPDALYTALCWAVERTPPPLAAEPPPKPGKSNKPVSPASSSGPLPPRR